ncbi:TPA: hypothetical protein EYP37_11355 [Candidatus Poribacteria bacterium]|nr:hypothetical protein [Candidatus Poribacteria bacterium]
MPGGKPGCLRGCLSLMVIVMLLAGVVLFVAYKRLGSEGIKTWLAIRSLDNLKRRILEIENLDVPRKEIERRIERAKEKLREGKGDLRRIYRTMDRFERELRKRVTSSQVKRFLDEIDGSVDVELSPPLR